MLRCMFYGLLRVGELTVGRSSDYLKVVSIDDLTIYRRDNIVTRHIEQVLVHIKT